MVYIHSWQEFQDAAEALYEQDPNKVSLNPFKFIHIVLMASRLAIA
jgi:hypothetical protein